MAVPGSGSPSTHYRAGTGNHAASVRIGGLEHVALVQPNNLAVFGESAESFQQTLFADTQAGSESLGRHGLSGFGQEIQDVLG